MPFASFSAAFGGLGNPPGPIDGLYGPLTQGAVERFQQRHGLAVDGIVGRQTKRRLFTRTARPTASPAHPETQPGRLERKSPAPHGGAESAERAATRPARARRCGEPCRAGAERPDVPPELHRALSPWPSACSSSARCGGSAGTGSRRASTSDLHVLRCSASSGSVRRPARSSRRRAAPGEADGATAQSGVLLARAEHATQHRRSSARATTSAAPAPRRAEAHASGSRGHAAARARRRTGSTRPSVSPPQLAAGRGPVTRPSAHPLRGEAGRLPVGIARSKLARSSSASSVARAVEKLADLNISTADPLRRSQRPRGGRGAEASMNALPDTGVGSALRRLRASSARLPPLFREAAQALCDNLGFERAAVFSLQGRTLTLETVHQRGADAAELRELTEEVGEPPSLGPWFHESEVLRRQRAVLVEDAESDPRALGLLPGVRSFVAASLVCHERPVGLDPRRPRDDRPAPHGLRPRHGLGVRRGPRVRARALRALRPAPGAVRARVVELVRSTEASVVALSRPEIELGTPAARAAPAQLRAQPASGARGRPHPPRARGSLDACRG